MAWDSTKTNYEGRVRDEAVTERVWAEDYNELVTYLKAHTADGTLHFTEASIDHANILNIGVNSHAQIDTHIADTDKHREINDVGTGLTDLWSASKINTELGTKSDTGHAHVEADITDLDKYTQSEVDSALALKRDITDSYSQAEVDALVAGKDQLSELTDVTLTGVSTGEFLQYTGSEWENKTKSEADIASAATLSSHTGDTAKHRIINDAGTSTTELWSANKINTELGTKSDTGHNHTLADITDSGTAAAFDTGTGAGNIPILDGSGKLNTLVMPALALTDVFTVASEVAQLALTAQEGDIAIRTDLNKSYAHNGGSLGTMADWSELLTPTDAVLSVAGKTGAVTLVASDITDFDTEVSNNTSVVANTTHITSDGSDHTFINQDVTTTGTPTFAGLDVNSGAVNLVANFESTDVTADIYLKDSSATSIIRSTGGSLRFSSDTSANMLNIDSAGNVGIGTTSPSVKLHTIGTKTASGASQWNVLLQDDTAQTAGVGAGIMLGGKYTDAGAYTFWAGIHSEKETSTTGEYGGELVFTTRDHGVTPAERMRISAEGNVGIGTTSPDGKVHIYDSAAGIIPQLTIQGSGSGDVSQCFEMYDGTTLWTMGIDNNQDDKFKIGYGANYVSGMTASITLDTSGNVGIGTTLPGAKLEVEQSAAATGLFIDQNGNGIALNIDSEVTTSNGFQLNCDLMTTGYAQRIDVDSLTSGVGLLVRSGSSSFSNTVSGLVDFLTTNSGSTGRILRVYNAGSGDTMQIHSVSDSKGLVIDHAASTQGNYALDITSTGNARAANIEQVGNEIALLIAKQGTGSGAAGYIINDGTGDGLFIDQNGNGIALKIDSECADANYGMLVQTPASNFAFGVTREDSVNSNNTVVMCGYHFWVDSTGKFRISGTVPTSDTSGVVVGTQT